MNKKFATAILVLATVSLAAQAAESMADYAHQALIKIEAPATWYRADVPFSVRAGAAHEDLRDLRVFNAANESLPFALTAVPRSRPGIARQEVSVPFFPLHSEEAIPVTDDEVVAQDNSLRIRRDAQGNVEIDIDSTHGVPVKKTLPPRPGTVLRGWLLDTRKVDFAPTRLFLDWQGSQEGFFRFTVAASDDLEHWSELTAAQIVHLTYSGQAIEQGAFTLPSRKARYLRVLFQDAGIAAGLRGVRLANIDTGINPEYGRLTWSDPLAGEALPEKEREFVWRFPLSLPLEWVKVESSPQNNILAPVIFSGRNTLHQPPQTSQTSQTPRQTRRHLTGGLHDVLRRGRHRQRSYEQPASNPVREEPYWVLAKGVVYSLAAEGLESNRFELPGTPINELRLQVDSRGTGLGTGAPRIMLALPALELTFLAKGEPPYRLAFGNANATRGDLPLSTVIPPDIAKTGIEKRIAQAQIASPSEIEIPKISPPTPPNPAPPPASPQAEPAATGPTTGKIILWAVLAVGALLAGGMAWSLIRTITKEKR
ncbi:MAG: DUF3999 domain-containing protein [Azoarcus sp.]|jgi:hypothetical protein|nr:DUF3999 domain-containing protein [Azoarcus sp.]